MPGVKANTQSKGSDKEKPGGGGAAGMKARTGGGAQISCTICKTVMNAKAARKMLQEHVDSKHAKSTFEACFPGYTE